MAVFVTKLYQNFDFGGKYILVDMPIQLVNQAFFLMQALPNKQIAMITNEEEITQTIEADIVLMMPNIFEIYAAKNYVAVAFNAHSFTEMDFSVTEDYIKLIVQMKANHILSFNHELKYEYRASNSKIKQHSSMLDKNITDILDGNYTLISRFPEILQGDDYWEYLWEKIAS